MKKGIRILLLFILFIPLFAKADMGAPTVRSYDAVVIKADGVDYYDWKYVKKGHLDKDTKIEVEYEVVEKKTIYLAFELKDNTYYVKSTDVAPLDEEVSYNDSEVDEYEESIKVKVNAKDGVEVRKGPSAAYEAKGTLDKGTTGKTRYYIEESGYIYIETDEVSGWVDTLEGAVVFYGGNYVVGEKIETTCGTVAVGTIIKDAWYSDAWSGNLYFDNKGCEDHYHWFKETAIVKGRNYTGNIKKKATLYEKPNSKKEVTTIPKDAKVRVLSDAYAEDLYDPTVTAYYYVEYEGKKGWIEALEEDQFSNVKEYDDEDIEEKDDDEEDDNKDEDKEDEKETKKEKKEEKDDEDSKQLDTKTIIIICVVGAGAFALGALATIILVNKKKNKN